jgi:hypothetical protein
MAPTRGSRERGTSRSAAPSRALRRHRTPLRAILGRRAEPSRTTVAMYLTVGTGSRNRTAAIQNRDPIERGHLMRTLYYFGLVL